MRAKFTLDKIERSLLIDYETEASQEVQTLTFSPVYGEPGSENRKFWDETPSGEIRLDVVNEAAYSKFELGKEYYVDFTPAE